MSFSYNPSEILMNIRQNKSFSSSVGGPKIPLVNHQNSSTFKQKANEKKPLIIVTREDSNPNIRINQSIGEASNQSIESQEARGESAEKIESLKSVDRSREEKQRNAAEVPLTQTEKANSFFGEEKRKTSLVGEHHIQHILTGYDNNNNNNYVSPKGEKSLVMEISRPNSPRNPDTEGLKADILKQLMEKIKRLETRVGPLEIELCQAKEEIRYLRLEKRDLEEQVKSIGECFYR